MSSSQHPEQRENPKILGNLEPTSGYLPRRRKRKAIAVLLAAVLPGLGHLYLKMIRRGILFIYVLIILISTILYFSSVRVGINVPLLIFLGLIIPCIYFYSLYDVLQSTDHVNKRGMIPQHSERIPKVIKDIGFGMLLILGGLIVFTLHQKPLWLTVFIQSSAGNIAATLIIALGITQFVREIYRKQLRMGRFTASSVMISTGVLAILDKAFHQDEMLLMLNWWPLALVSLGLEYLVLLLWKRVRRKGTSRRLRLDIGGVVLSAALAFSFFAITQQDHYLHLWNRVSLDLTAAGSEFSDQKGYTSGLKDVEIPVTSDMKEIRLDGVNGRIGIIKADVPSIRIKSVLWVDQLKVEDAYKIAKDIGIEVEEGKTTSISVKDRTYGASGKRHPRVNLTILIPENTKFDFNLSTTNGGISLVNIQADAKITLQTGSGNIYLRNVIGDVSAKTLNGRVELDGVTGEVHAETLGGRMSARDIFGPITLDTMIGDISVNHADDDIKVSTRNGNIVVNSAYYKLQAESLNGQIEVRSPIVGGDWSIYSAVGDIKMAIPESGNYTIQGSSGYGSIVTDLPFVMKNKSLQGELGLGKYKVNVEGNSDMKIVKYIE
ncbi:TM2 domain-containing membrane protein YozV [Paenibacillus shirakamiensis]|uniref:TM2 domain-containing membrane protein YozV n=1 Tax=Paenibacillus shirakamiensis TaxID=1265935 RepID=A0ABS4JLC4_9BACL|nr:DUF4097 family beta strand repeat-containing protein [Paenibacillus shirakamiensis]MBP2002488.1 TM2 domain-containing membrane protein YozV [Paenibacillus shirakamiensis]